MKGSNVPKTTPEQNKSLVMEAFDTLFNKRDYAAAERFWSPDYIQHSAHIAPGREGLFNLIKSLPPTLKYEPGTIVAEGNFVIVHGRFSNFGLPVNWIATDIVSIKDGVLVEHWDLVQLHQEMEVGYCRLVTISTDNMEVRPSSIHFAPGPYL